MSDGAIGTIVDEALDRDADDPGEAHGYLVRLKTPPAPAAGDPAARDVLYFWSALDTCLPNGACVRVDDAIEPGWDRYGQGLVERIDTDRRVYLLRGRGGRDLEVSFGAVRC